MPLRFLAILLVSLSFCSCQKSGQDTTEAKSAPSASPNSSSQKEEEVKAAEEATPDPEALKDPEYGAVLAKFRREVETYWNERFIKCADPSTSDDRWFSVVIDGTEKKYLEVRNLSWTPAIPGRSNYAQTLEKEWYGMSLLLMKVHRWCPDGKPCEKYDSRDLKLLLEFKMEKGKFSFTRTQDIGYYKPDSCDEVKNLPIWQTP